MSWKDNLQDASFRGVPFKVRAHSLSGGRRVKDTERWQARTITTDMGPILPVFNVDAYVIQSLENDFDYFNNRDKLLDALQNNPKNEPLNVGTLIHPFYGRRKVHAAEYNVEESFDEGGICHFTITFLLEEDELFPGQITNPASKMDMTCLQVYNYAIDNFIKTMKKNMAFVEDIGRDAVLFMQKTQQGINSVNNIMRSSLATATGIISMAINTIYSVLDSPCDLYDTLRDSSEAFKNLVGMAGTVVQGGVVGGCSGTVRGEQNTMDGTSIPESLGSSVVLNMIDSQDMDESTLPIISETQTDNRTLVIDIIKLQILSCACQIFVRIEFSSKQQLLTYLNKLLDAIDELLLRLGDQVDLDVTDMYVSAELLRSTVAELMYEKLDTLQNEITYKTSYGTMSTLELAYNLYEDTNRCSEIFEKNKIAIKHPGFLPQDDEVQVLEA